MTAHEPESHAPASNLRELERWYDEYRRVRTKFMRRLGIERSQRDPIVEFAEHVVAVLVGGRLSDNRVQPGWDVLRPNGRRLQVRTLSNRWSNEWVNEHIVQFTSGCDEYALVIFGGRYLHWVIIFQRERNLEVYKALSKRHGEPESRLNITRLNMEQIYSEQERFGRLGVEIHPIRPGNPFARVGTD